MIAWKLSQVIITMQVPKHGWERVRGIPVEHFLLHMDNASSHTAVVTQLEIGVLGFGSV